MPQVSLLKTYDIACILTVIRYQEPNGGLVLVAQANHVLELGLVACQVLVTQLRNLVSKSS